jgi:hypothetical protein
MEIIFISTFPPFFFSTHRNNKKPVALQTMKSFIISTIQSYENLVALVISN